MKEKEKNIYGIHQYTLTRRRKIRGNSGRTALHVYSLSLWKVGMRERRQRECRFS
jgi:hypothetical protein